MLFSIIGLGAVNSISATQSGHYLASAGHDGHVYFWNTSTGRGVVSVGVGSMGAIAPFNFEIGLIAPIEIC